MKLKDNNSSENRIRLQAVLNERKPFALYLRNYSTEEGATVLTIMPSKELEYQADTPLGLRYWPVENNVLENSIVDEISKFMPIFALLNRKDASVGNAYRIEVAEGENWFVEFATLAIRSTLIVMVAEKETVGIMQEIHWIDKHEVHSRLVLIISDQFKEILKVKMPGFIDRVEWIISPVADQSGAFRLSMLSVPSALLSFVRDLSKAGQANGLQ